MRSTRRIRRSHTRHDVRARCRGRPGMSDRVRSAGALRHVPRTAFGFPKRPREFGDGWRFANRTGFRVRACDPHRVA